MLSFLSIQMQLYCISFAKHLTTTQYYIKYLIESMFKQEYLLWLLKHRMWSFKCVYVNKFTWRFLWMSEHISDLLCPWKDKTVFDWNCVSFFKERKLSWSRIL